MQLTWRASQSASCFHAAVAETDGLTLVDRELAAAIAGPREQLWNELAESGLPPAEILREMYSLTASGIEGNQLLVQRALLRRTGLAQTSEGAVMRVTGISSRIAGRVRDLEVAYRKYFADRHGPPIVDELELRSQPLREQWQAYGPGLMHTIGRLTEPELLVESAEVVLVMPAIGGHGVAHLGNNRVTIEAVLANPVQAIPEVVRLAWLLSQLQIDLPRYSERIPRRRHDWIAMHALLPPALAAAREVEIVPQGVELIPQTLDAWYVGDSTDAAGRAEVLADWWTTFVQNPPAWPVALGALDALLPPEK